MVYAGADRPAHTAGVQAAGGDTTQWRRGRNRGGRRFRTRRCRRLREWPAIRPRGSFPHPSSDLSRRGQQFGRPEVSQSPAAMPRPGAPQVMRPGAPAVFGRASPAGIARTAPQVAARPAAPAPQKKK